jgi:hypothetical protein
VRTYDGKVGELAQQLVAKWKNMVAETEKQQQQQQQQQNYNSDSKSNTCEKKYQIIYIFF